MKEEYKDLPLVKNSSSHRFEMPVGEYMAMITYRQNENRITLLHTSVSPELEGKGAATAIIEKTLDFLDTHHFKLIPVCPLVAAYLRRHPGWERILVRKVKS